MTATTSISELAHAVGKHAASGEGDNAAAEQLRDLLFAELDRAGTTLGLLDAFELTPALRAARVARIRVEEEYLSNDRRLMATMLVPVFAATAFYKFTIEKISFEVADRRGRMIGARIAEWEAGGVFFAHRIATRAGRSYGGWRPPMEFETAAARASWRSRYLAEATRRAVARRGR